MTKLHLHIQTYFFVKNQVFVGVWNNVIGFDLIQLVDLSVSMPIPRCFYYCNSVVELEISECDTSGSYFIVEYWFGYPVIFVFPYEFEVCEELWCDIDEECIESVDCFW